MAEEAPNTPGGLAGMAERLESLFGPFTSEPVDRFCQMIAELPDFGRQEAIRVCCIGLGWEVDPEEALKASNPAAELFRLPGMEDLRARLNFVVLKVKLREMLLLPGLYRYMLEFFERLSQPTATSAAIDQDLEWLRKLEAWKKLPVKERPAGFEDDAIERAIPMVKERMTQRSGQREAAREMARQLERDWKKTFPDEYWQDWLKRLAEKS